MALINPRRVLISLALSTLPIALPAACADPPGFAQLLPDQVTWTPGKSTPPGGQSASIYGNPAKPGMFIVRFKQPADYKVAPHRHPEERVYTVMSGTFYIGFGDHFDPAALRAYPTGSVFVVPANASHFHWMRSGEAVVQITGVGPSGIDYVDADDDPRKH
jgi:quercetin dioxygenase-like cupin family protein